MALEKDKERPTSPKQRLSIQNRASSEGFGSTINSNSNMKVTKQDQNESR